MNGPFVEGHLQLQGSGITICPMDERLADELWFGLEPDPETFRWFTSVPHDWSREAYKEFLGTLAKIGFCHAILADGRCVGSSTLFDIRGKDRGLEIGYTHYAPHVRGTQVNPIAKGLFFESLIERQLANRVQLKTDLRNIASQKAMAKLGLVREGVLRRVVVMPDGHVRDTVYFSLVPEDWPSVRETIGRVVEGKRPWP